MEAPRRRTPARGGPRPRSEYRPPPFGFANVRFFVDKFEASSDPPIVERSTVLVKLESVVHRAEELRGSGFRPVESGVLRRFLGGLVPRVTLANLGVCAVAAALVAPKMISYLLLYPFCRLLFGTLYPAYASYKAVRTKNLKEYVKWMMYWIVFALFTCAETFTDVFLSWFPFYYEVKIVLVLWLLSPATKGSSILYRKFVHPALSRREQEIDDAIAKAKEQGYHTVLNLGSKGVNYATTVIMQTAIRGGGGLVQQLKKSYSLSDLSETAPRSSTDQDMVDEAEDVLSDPRLIRRSIARSGYNTRRSASESNNRTPIYFSEVDVDVRSTRSTAGSDAPNFSHIKSSEDISSGYSSAENSGALGAGGGGGGGGGGALARAGSVGAAARPRTRLAARGTVTAIKRPGAAEGSDVIIEELEDNENFDFTDLPPLLNLPPTCHISQTNPPFLFEYVGNQINIIQVLGDVSKNDVGTTNIFGMYQSDIPLVKDGSVNTDMHSETVAKVKDKIEAIPETTLKEIPNVIIPADQTVKDNDIDSKGETVHVGQNVQQVPVNIEADNKSKSKPDSISSELKLLGESTIEIKTVKGTLNPYEETSVNTSLLIAERKQSYSMSSSSASLNSAKTSPSIGSEVSAETVSIETSSLNDDAVETDDEGSYGTPDDSPKAKKKLGNRGKYGKSKAPPPPDGKSDLKMTSDGKKIDTFSTNGDGVTYSFSDIYAQPTEFIKSIELKDVGSLPSTSHADKPPETYATHGHISKRKHRQKSKSPVGRKTKNGTSPISRLMQLPGKLAFWHKADDDKAKKDTWSTSSDEPSPRSSKAEKVSGEIQSCIDLQEAINKATVEGVGPRENIPTITISASVDHDTKVTATQELVTAIDLEESIIAKDILDKSDALQKLIEAKLESHPEYKIISLIDEEMPTMSKSTEV